MSENTIKKIIIAYLLEYADLKESTRDNLYCMGTKLDLNYLSNLLSRCWKSIRRGKQLQLLEELGEINGIN